MEWGPELVSEIVALLERGRQNIIVLVASEQLTNLYLPTLKETVSTGIRRERPHYLEWVNGSWVLFVPITQVDRMRGIGIPHCVYWPTENFDYKGVSWEQWYSETHHEFRWRTPDPPPEGETPLVEEVILRKSSWEHLLEGE